MCIIIVRKIIKACKGSIKPVVSPRRNCKYPFDNGKVKEYIIKNKGNKILFLKRFLKNKIILIYQNNKTNSTL